MNLNVHDATQITMEKLTVAYTRELKNTLPKTLPKYIITLLLTMNLTISKTFCK